MLSSESSPTSPRGASKRVRIIKKVRVTGGIWKFISLDRIGSRYVWDKQPGYYFIEWWDGRSRRRERAGETPSQALEAQRRKRNELIGEMAVRGRVFKSAEEGGSAILIEKATKARRRAQHCRRELLRFRVTIPIAHTAVV